MIMKIYLLKPKEEQKEGDNPWRPWYDKAFGFVIIAENEEEARKIANENGGDETGKISNMVYRTGGNPWLSDEYSTCVELTAEHGKGVVIRDFASA